MIIRSVVTSSAIDGIRVAFKRRHKSADEIRVRGIRSKVSIDAAAAPREKASQAMRLPSGEARFVQFGMKSHLIRTNERERRWRSS